MASKREMGPDLREPVPGPRRPRIVGMEPAAALALLEGHGVRFLRLQVTDVHGTPRHIDLPVRRLGMALDQGVVFDGATVGGFVRLEEAEMLLRPDPATLSLLATPDPEVRGARLTCDIARADGAPWEGDPRGALRRVLAAYAAAGVRPLAAPQIEFFLFPGPDRPDARGVPINVAEAVLLQVARVLEDSGVSVGAMHPEAGGSQFEIDLAAADPLKAADDLIAVKQTVRRVASRHGVCATFMPKPVAGVHGCGLHVYYTLLRGGENAFSDPEANDGLSPTLRHFAAGVLRHARGACAVSNPLVNSYKRLVPGFAAPVHATWSLQSGASLVRIPPWRGQDTSCEVRVADPSANPYLVLAAQLASGLDGIEREEEPGTPVAGALAAMSERELQRRRIASLPRSLGEALVALEEDRVVRGALGEYLYSQLVEAKRAEWEEYAAQVSDWERERYFDA